MNDRIEKLKKNISRIEEEREEKIKVLNEKFVTNIVIFRINNMDSNGRTQIKQLITKIANKRIL